MTVIAATLAITVVWTYLTVIPVGYARRKMERGYNNVNPRDQQALLTGWGKRAHAAHLNAFEALIVFAATAAVVIATGKVSPYAPSLCAAFLASRVVFEVCYLANWPRTRSAMWFIGFVACLGLILGAFCK